MNKPRRELVGDHRPLTCKVMGLNRRPTARKSLPLLMIMERLKAVEECAVYYSINAGIGLNCL